MKLPSVHDEFPTQPDLPPDLRRIDETIGDLAARQLTPPGLTDRIYEASVSALPQRLRLRGRSVVAPHQRLRFHRPVWGQLAMAASIGLAFVLAAWFLAVPAGVSERGALPGAVAQLDDRPIVRTVAHHQAAPLTPEAEWLLLDSVFNGGRASHLVETRDLTIADLRSESERLFDEFEL